MGNRGVRKSYLFIPHSPLQFEVFGYWAEVIAASTEFSPICLLITKDLSFRLDEGHAYDKVISLDDLLQSELCENHLENIKVLTEFEREHEDCLFSVDWSIDRAFQNIHQPYETAVRLTAKIIKALKKIVEEKNVIGALSEKLFIPQRVVNYLLIKNGGQHVLPIGDRFFKRFYFEKGLNEWYWPDIQKAYENNRALQLEQVSKEVKEVYDRVVFKKYKKVFDDASQNSRTKGTMKKIRTRINRPSYSNIYAEYLFSGLKQSVFNKYHLKAQKRKNIKDYNKVVSRDVPTSSFVLFLFHMQPEYTVDGIANEFFNQVEFVIAIARNLPSDTVIVVKENPRSVGNLNRPIEYYNDLLRFPNIVFLHHSSDSHELIEQSMVVVTLTGTVGIEALMKNKPVIVVGRIFYRFFDGIISVNSVDEVVGEILKIKAGSFSPFATDEERYIFGLRLLSSFRDATYPGQMYNGFSPAAHKSVDNIALLKAGFKTYLSQEVLNAAD